MRRRSHSFSMLTFAAATIVTLAVAGAVALAASLWSLFSVRTSAYLLFLRMSVANELAHIALVVATYFTGDPATQEIVGIASTFAGCLSLLLFAWAGQRFVVLLAPHTRLVTPQAVRTAGHVLTCVTVLMLGGVFYPFLPAPLDAIAFLLNMAMIVVIGASDSAIQLGLLYLLLFRLKRVSWGLRAQYLAVILAGAGLLLGGTLLHGFGREITSDRVAMANLFVPMYLACAVGMLQIVRVALLAESRLGGTCLEDGSAADVPAARLRVESTGAGRKSSWRPLMGGRTVGRGGRKKRTARSDKAAKSTVVMAATQIETRQGLE
ncbi:hypothetical protein HK105_208070 [Polyrhizophydium stewartii]|uniref:Uncharacterized protein n=1 Tax=Polyrhizophydium stewartii TaxID=2732419 RepID=A0ABR4MYS9_9FUNG